jgi:hypothetical protein
MIGSTSCSTWSPWAGPQAKSPRRQLARACSRSMCPQGMCCSAITALAPRQGFWRPWGSRPPLLSSAGIPSGRCLIRRPPTARWISVPSSSPKLRARLGREQSCSKTLRRAKPKLSAFSTVPALARACRRRQRTRHGRKAPGSSNTSREHGLPSPCFSGSFLAYVRLYHPPSAVEKPRWRLIAAAGPLHGLFQACRGSARAIRCAPNIAASAQPSMCRATSVIRCA